MHLNAAGQGRKPFAALAAGAVGLAFLACLWLLAGCAAPGPRDEGPRADETPPGEMAGRPDASAPAAGKRFEEPGELDRMLDSKPIALAAVKPASQSQPGTAAKAPEPVSKGRGNFRIQVGAESDVDAAQAKKAEYEKLLGGSVDVVFDAPYYKLRWGWFDSKQDAEDKILELTDFKIQGFVIKQ